MDLNEYTIFIDGEDRTKEIKSCTNNRYSNSYAIVYRNSDKVYTYNKKRVVIKKNNLNDYEVFSYLKGLAALNTIRGENNEKLLSNIYNRINYVNETSVLAKYLKGKIVNDIDEKSDTYIFPFGANNSQIEAVKNAFKYQVSIIEGPPGTGKTQTILNIIANLLTRGKTVQIVSNNNSAIENVHEKLIKNDLGFIVALLGSKSNKENFLENQDGSYPNCLSDWCYNGSIVDLKNKIKANLIELQKIFNAQVEIKTIKAELDELLTERKHFEIYLEENKMFVSKFSSLFKLSSKRLLKFIDEYQNAEHEKRSLYIIFCFWCALKYGVIDRNFWLQDEKFIIASLQYKFYEIRERELIKKKNDLETFLDSKDSNLLKRMCSESIIVLKDYLQNRYAYNKERIKFSMNDFAHNSQKFLTEYPVVMSTTFSSATCLSDSVMYDYVIMDEASQVDVATGALSLCHSRNAVIVGDSKQLTNVIENDIKKSSERLFQEFKVNDCYKLSNSFLKSIKDQLPDERCVLLREHYRCHPRIIEFCNKKFYHGELVTMTKDSGENDVLKVITTNEGNHGRIGNRNQREIDVIKNEVLCGEYGADKDVGIISPYRNQVEELKRQINNIEIDTVHKYQGREKDYIIISTVDNQITDFVDDANMLNVAVSRAKYKLCLVTTGNKQIKNGNISDLIAYIRYNNFQVQKSRIRSVFDYLYSQYTKQRIEFLRKHNSISKYNSENLMYVLLLEILKEDEFSALEVVVHMPLYMLINMSEGCNLNDEEMRYAMNPLTHIDFVVVNKLSKLPVLLIEVDGVSYHMPGSKQAKRDEIKNSVLDKYNLPYIRLKTNGSEERKVITEILRDKVKYYIPIL